MPVAACETLAKVEASLDDLAGFVADAKASGLRVAHCHGVFDVLHPGTVRRLEAARRAAERLVVTVAADSCFAGAAQRPAYNERLRAEGVAALAAVDRVAVSAAPATRDVALALRADVFAAAADLSAVASGDGVELDAIRDLGIEVLAEPQLADSPRALNRFFSAFPPETVEYLQDLRTRYGAAEVAARLEALRSLRVLVLGDIILDEYHYCKAVGKSSKSATLTARFLSAERHAGGVLAIANHAASFAAEVRLLCVSGSPSSDDDFIRAHLKPNVRPHLVRDRERPNVVKRRYVDPFQLSKMLEVMWLDGDEPAPATEERLLAAMPALAEGCDLVLVGDFGHGAIGARTIEWLAAKAPFLAVNTQTNSGNLGFNLITKYPRADYLSIDEQELQLACRTRSQDAARLLDATARTAACRLASVTLGGRGSLTWSANGACVRTPVLSTHVVDSVGAGDAYLAVTALCARLDYPPEIVGFIGNCAGALAVHIVGNRESVEKAALLELAGALL
jgi:bifunctional ADP-heptose synthase (sugar kinase/adenylyltransferase)